MYPNLSVSRNITTLSVTQKNIIPSSPFVSHCRSSSLRLLKVDVFVSFLSSLIAVPLSEEESRFLGVLQGGESVWTGDGDVGRRHAVPVGHQTRPDVGGVGGTEEAAVLQLQHKNKVLSAPFDFNIRLFKSLHFRCKQKLLTGSSSGPESRHDTVMTQWGRGGVMEGGTVTGGRRITYISVTLIPFSGSKQINWLSAS